MTIAFEAPLVRERARTAAPSTVNPVVRAAFYLFVFSIPFELPQRTIPYEVPTLMGMLFLATTVLNPSACYRRLPAAGWWFVAYLWAFALVTVVIAGDYPALVWQWPGRRRARPGSTRRAGARAGTPGARREPCRRW